MPFRDMDEVREANRGLGQNWFAADTLRWWRSRVSEQLYGGRYFVTSEQDRTGMAWDGRRRYTVRRASDEGWIDTIGEFGDYMTPADAHRAARRLAESDPQGGPAGPREGNE